MKNNVLRIATRKSPLALWQAEYVKKRLLEKYSTLEIKLVPIVTKGDRILDRQLAKIGGKGLFVKELENALFENQADIAVHSMKDVPHQFPDGLTLSTICKRADPRDAFVSPHYTSFSQLPENAVVGTSSLRRQCQLLANRPDLQVKCLRGNVNTRLKKVEDGEYDATILAAAGLHRLEMNDKINHYFEVDELLPSAGQGALGIEIRTDDQQVRDIINILSDEPTTICLTAERAVNKSLGGSCQVPIGAYAIIEDQQLTINALIADPQNNRILSTIKSGNKNCAFEIGTAAADELISQGARQIMQRLLS